MRVLLFLLLLPAGVLLSSHSLPWTGLADHSSSLSLEARELFARPGYSRKRAKRRAENLFESEEEEYDEEDEEVMGSLFTHFLADSNQQLLLDLDFFRHFFNYAEAYRLGMEQGDVDLMKVLVKIVEKLRQFDISPECTSDMFYLAWTAVEYATYVEETKNCTDCKCTPLNQQKRNERTWIFDVLDSIGKVPSGILGGNNLWVGSWTTCRKIHVLKNSQGQNWNGQYCMAHLSAYERDNPLKALSKNGPIDEHCHQNQSETSTVSADDGQCFQLIPMLNFGVCAPDSCTDYDVTRMITFAIRAAEGALGREAVCEVAVECRRETQETAMSNHRLAMWALYFVIFTVAMMAFGTLYDLFVFQAELQNLSSFEARKHEEKSHLFVRVILAYSAYKNGCWVLNTKKNEGDIECLHGMRVLSMCWIILGHTYYYIGKSLTTDNLIPTLINFPKMFYTQIIVQAPLAVDSFFFLSGLLSSYLFFKRVFKAKTLRKYWSPLVWLTIAAKRYTRITPTYAVIMLMDVTLFMYISSGPFWRPVEPDGCRISGWTNFIYMNNFLLQDKECCMGWTWYLANDMQLHILMAPILVIAFCKDKRWGYAISALFIALSSIIHLWIVFAFDYPPAPILDAKLKIVEKLDAYWNDVYIRPYVRCVPFIMGVILAYILNRITDGNSLKMKMTKKQVIVGWTISTILGLYSVFGLFYYAKTGDISEWWRGLYALVGRPSYALAIAWVAFACATGNGGPVNTFLGWKLFVPLSKITYCAYLLHPILLQVYNLSRPQPFHFTTFFQMLRHTMEAVFVAYALAFFFALAFERPFFHIDEMIIPVQKRGHQQSRENANEEANEEAVPLNQLEKAST